MSQQKYSKAYEAYQQAVYRDGRNPTFWCSIGVLYYQINQYRDALDAYSRAIRLNPYISEVWYDLGTLVSLYGSIHAWTLRLTFGSMNRVTIRLPMHWTHINALSTSTRPICTLRHGYSFYATMANPRECPTSKTHLCRKMYIPSNTKLLALGLLQARNGACLQEGQLQFFMVLPQAKMARRLTGAGDWQTFQTHNPLLSHPACMISANQFDRHHHRGNPALGRNSYGSIKSSSAILLSGDLHRRQP